MPGPRIRIATRGSPLALWQAGLVADRLRSVAGCGTDIVVVETLADRRTAVPLRTIGAQGAFTREVGRAVVDGRADIAVHSAKDLPSSPLLLDERLVLAAVPERGEARDALVGGALPDLVAGATIATGSVRRRAQLAWLRPDLGFVDLRGNIGTRLGKCPPGGAVVVAAVALERLGLAGEISQMFDLAEMLPQVGQGALAVECRADDGEVRSLLLAAVDHAPSRLAVAAERAFLAQLGGGCDLPVGAYARIVRSARWRAGPERPVGLLTDGPEIVLEALIASPDGHVITRHSAAGHDPELLGRQVASVLIDNRGASSLLPPGIAASDW